MVRFQCLKCSYFEISMEEQATAVGMAFPEQGLTAQKYRLQSAHAIQPLPFSFPPIPHALFPVQLLMPVKPIPKPCCSINQCNRVAASECRLCKPCCQGQGQGCCSTKHQLGPPTMKEPNMFTPSCPTTATTFLPSTSTTSPTFQPPPFSSQTSSTLALGLTPKLPEPQAPRSF